MLQKPSSSGLGLGRDEQRQSWRMLWRVRGSCHPAAWLTAIRHFGSDTQPKGCSEATNLGSSRPVGHCRVTCSRPTTAVTQPTAITARTAVTVVIAITTRTASRGGQGGRSAHGGPSHDGHGDCKAHDESNGLGGHGARVSERGWPWHRLATASGAPNHSTSTAGGRVQMIIGWRG